HMSTCSFRFFFSDPAPTGIYPLSLHDALPIFGEGVTYFCHCTYPVIGHAIHNDGGAVNAVTFITDLFVIHAFQSAGAALDGTRRSEEHTSELQSRENLVCRLLLEKKNRQQRLT